MERVLHEEQRLSFFEKYLTLWIIGCIGLGISLGKLFPRLAVNLDKISIYQVSVPIAICLFFMMYPIMVKIDFAEVIKAGKAPKPVLLTLFVNWCIKPFTMLAISTLFLGVLFKGLLPGF
ncbi:MAG: arsenical-resistance protein, partial [Candidatus Omnitrophica bacterium]|nr:arsenical-resistance protein [Candidatus Omnitrophota bacterium]